MDRLDRVNKIDKLLKLECEHLDDQMIDQQGYARINGEIIDTSDTVKLKFPEGRILEYALIKVLTGQIWLFVFRKESVTETLGPSDNIIGLIDNWIEQLGGNHG